MSKSQIQKMKKMKYEKPVILNLGEMAKGRGYCQNGTGNGTYGCDTGINANIACQNGTGNYVASCGIGTAAYGDLCNMGDANTEVFQCNFGDGPA